MPIILPEVLLSILLWSLLGLAGQMVLLILTGAWIQIRRDRFTRFHIACRRRWEEAIVVYLYGGVRDLSAFEHLSAKERRLLVPFLERVLNVFSGGEGEVVRELYHTLNLDRGLQKRLRARSPRARGLAALEVSQFRLTEHYPDVCGMLEDRIPHVAHAAACSLASIQDLRYAGKVLDWMLNQDVFQRERMLWILESFGPELLRWMEAGMDGAEEPDPRFQELYVLLVGSFRDHGTLPRVLNLLDSGTIEVKAAALKTLGALGNPEAFARLLPFIDDGEWVLRGQVAKVLGLLGGSDAIPHLTRLMADPVYDVRRNAAYALSQLGSNGVKALEWISMYEHGDPFARDLASERLQWAHLRGR